MTNACERDDDGHPTYAFKASLAGGVYRFTLKPDVLEWQAGRRTGSVRYDRIQAVRLSYRPVTMQSQRFVAQVRAAGQPKFQIVSVTWHSMFEQRRQDAAYSAFIAELHRRMAAAGGRARFSAGLPVLVYWTGVVVFAAVLAATAALIVRVVGVAQWSATTILAIFFATFVYQIGNYFRRNWPGVYRPDAIPEAVLPMVQG